MRLLIIVSVFLAALMPRPATAGHGLLEPGQPFPEWSLSDQSGTVVSSAALAGKPYVVWFFPRAMTPGCTVEGRGFRDLHGEFESAGVVVLGVSFDPPERNALFVEQEDFPFSLLSDEERRLATAVGAADSRDQAAARRISYLIGPDGRIWDVYGDVDTRGHARTVLDDVRRNANPEARLVPGSAPREVGENPIPVAVSILDRPKAARP